MAQKNPELARVIQGLLSGGAGFLATGDCQEALYSLGLDANAYNELREVNPTDAERQAINQAAEALDVLVAQAPALARAGVIASGLQAVIQAAQRHVADRIDRMVQADPSYQAEMRALADEDTSG